MIGWKPPHPNPSPQRGEGLSFRLDRDSLAPRERGEGWGEGHALAPSRNPIDDMVFRFAGIDFRDRLAADGNACLMDRARIA